MPAMCAGLPDPGAPANALSGLAFNHPINSDTSFAGKAFFETINCGLSAISEIGSKSFSRSYESA